MIHMKTRLTSKNVLLLVVACLFIIQALTISYLVHSKNYLHKQLQDENFANQLLYNELDSVAQQHNLQALPGQNALYIEELNLVIPANEISRTIRVQNYSQATANEIRLSSSAMTDHSQHIQSCSDMVRLKIEPKPDAYSPDQPLYANVKLADNRTLQIYASTTKECQAAWREVSPQNIAAQFIGAKSY